MTIDSEISKQEELCNERFVRKPGLIAVLSSVACLLLSAWGIVSYALTNERRVTIIETDVTSCKSKIYELSQINTKLDTLLSRTSR